MKDIVMEEVKKAFNPEFLNRIDEIIVFHPLTKEDMAKILNIIESAYRATLEEQDDTIVWISHAMKGGGADLDVLLRGNAVNYAVKGQHVDPLQFGSREQKHAPDIEGDIVALAGKGVRIHLVKEDAAERGLEVSDFVDGIEPIGRDGLPKLMGNYDRIWHW